MGQRWFISSALFIFCFFGFSNSLFVHPVNSGGRNDIDPSTWDNESDNFDFSRLAPEHNSEENFEKPKKTLTEQPASEEIERKSRWLNILSFDKSYNLTEKDQGPKNETKLILINAEDHLKIYEKEDKGNNDTQLENGIEEGKNIFRLLNPEGLLSQTEYKDQTNGLERSKREAENGKRICRCRRKGRRNMMRRRRRRRRRNRVGQQRPARRRRRRRGRRRNGRRGRRRCVCRKKEEGEGEGEGEGKSEGEEPEVEEADGAEEEEEGTTTEGMDETATEEAESGDEGEEEDEDESEADYEDDSAEDDEESDEGESSKEGGNEIKTSEKEMPSVATYPAYVVPYPNMIETPIAVMPARGYPMGTIPTGAIPMYKFPSHSALGALVLRKSVSKTED